MSNEAVETICLTAVIISVIWAFVKYDGRVK